MQTHHAPHPVAASAARHSAGGALLPFPSAHGFPWFVSDWGTLTVNPMARKQYQLQPGEVLDFAVRVVAHDGDAEQADIPALYRAFAADNAPV